MSQTLAFSLIALAACGGCIALLASSMLRRRGPAAEDPVRSENILAARERLSQLDEQVGQGLLEEAEAQEYREEIEGQLLSDVGDADASASERRRDIAGIAICSALILVAAPSLYALYGAPHFLLHEQERIQKAVVIDFTERMELAEELIASGDHAGAAEVYDGLRASYGDSEELIMLTLKARALSGGDTEGLIEEGLRLNPDSPLFLLFAGMASRRDGDLEKARSYWRRGALSPEAGEEMRGRFERMLAELDQAPGMQP